MFAAMTRGSPQICANAGEPQPKQNIHHGGTEKLKSQNQNLNTEDTEKMVTLLIEELFFNFGSIGISDPRIIRTPVSNGFLDIGTAELFLDSALEESRQFRVRGKAQSDDLRIRQFGDAGA